MKTKNAYCFGGDQIQRKDTNKQFSQHPTCLRGYPKKMRMPVFQYGYFNKLYAWAPQKLPECLQRTESANAVRPNNKLLIASTEIGFLITP